MEIWKQVVGWEGFYEVSDMGQVRSVDRTVDWNNTRSFRRGRTLRSAKMKNSDHRVVRLMREGHGNVQKVHRLVLLAFVGPCPEGMIACHNNGDAADNRVVNLRWDTYSSNVLDSIEHGTHVNASKTHCIHGHEFTPENTYFYSYSYKHERVCKTCTYDRSRVYALRRIGKSV